MTKSPASLAVAASLIGAYLRLVRATTRFVTEPAPVGPAAARLAPFIGVGWHGQFLLLPVIGIEGQAFDALVSRHTDGELVARVIGRFGHGTVRGSGTDTPARMHEKGGVAAFRAMKDSLDGGRSVVATADFSRSARREVSRGIVTLARVSGRPVVPLAIATSRAVEITSWDRTAINLPFSRGALVAGEEVYVPRDADDALAEELRLKIGAGIDAANARAREIVHGRHG